MFRILVAAAIAVTLGAPGVGATDPAPAADARLAKFQQAHGAIRTSLSRPDAPPPSLSDPAYATLVSEAFDPTILDALKDQSLHRVVEVCGEVARTEAAYGRRGLTASDLAGLDARAAVARKLRVLTTNTVEFQDELGAGRRLEVACTALETEKFEVTVRSQRPEDLAQPQRASLAMLQTGLLEVVGAAPLNVLGPVRPANREAVLDALTDHLGPIAAAMTKASRDKADKTIDGVLASPTLSRSVRGRLTALRRALDQAECNAICRLS